MNDAGLALSAALLAQRIGDRSLARKTLAALEQHPDLRAYPTTAEIAVVLRAQEARLSGRPQEAIDLLRPLLNGSERYQTHVALMEAYADAGQLDMALEQSRWLQRRRGLAYSELGFGQSLQALNVADSHLAMLREAELLERSKKPAEARRVLKNFYQDWPAEALPDYLSLKAFAPASRFGLV